MDKKSKILFLVFGLLLAGSLLATYYRYIVVKDYVIEAQVNCDPLTEQCFVVVCDPEMGEECSGNREEDTSYYKILHRNARHIPACNPEAPDCPVTACQVGEEGCFVILCDPSVEGATCSDPETYQREHPVGAENEGLENGGASEDEMMEDSNAPKEGEEMDMASDEQE
jgi:hypothetical protein